MHPLGCNVYMIYGNFCKQNLQGFFNHLYKIIQFLSESEGFINSNVYII
jgi:hypothetical protein